MGKTFLSIRGPQKKDANLNMIHHKAPQKTNRLKTSLIRVDHIAYRWPKTTSNRKGAGVLIIL